MNTIDDDLGRGIDLADLLAVLLAQPDAETAIDGMHKVAQFIGEHARSIKRHPTPAPRPSLSAVHHIEPNAGGTA